MYIFWIISAIIMIIVIARQDKKKSTREEDYKTIWHTKVGEYEEWKDSYEGRKKIYSILLVCSFIPGVNILLALSPIVICVILIIIALIKKFLDKIL